MAGGDGLGGSPFSPESGVAGVDGETGGVACGGLAGRARARRPRAASGVRGAGPEGHACALAPHPARSASGRGEGGAPAPACLPPPGTRTRLDLRPTRRRRPSGRQRHPWPARGGRRPGGGVQEGVALRGRLAPAHVGHWAALRRGEGSTASAGTGFGCHAPGPTAPRAQPGAPRSHRAPARTRRPQNSHRHRGRPRPPA